MKIILMFQNSKLAMIFRNVISELYDLFFSLNHDDFLRSQSLSNIFSAIKRKNDERNIHQYLNYDWNYLTSEFTNIISFYKTLIIVNLEKLNNYHYSSGSTRNFSMEKFRKENIKLLIKVTEKFFHNIFNI